MSIDEDDDYYWNDADADDDDDNDEQRATHVKAKGVFQLMFKWEKCF